ncbi:MAG: hypothetical protein IMZ74_16425, partial [Actinobacteria bacterium]|nr:hypothetical protein [Actinomycetota bacterium]
VLTRTHHALIDGASGMDITVNLLDLTPEPADIPPPTEPWKPDAIPSDLELIGYAATSLARQPLSAFKAVRRTTEAMLNVRSRNRQPDVTPPPAPFSAPNTPFNGAITARRSFGMAEIPLDDVKELRKQVGGTINDIVLALCAASPLPNSRVMDQLSASRHSASTGHVCAAHSSRSAAHSGARRWFRPSAKNSAGPKDSTNHSIQARMAQAVNASVAATMSSRAGKDGSRSKATQISSVQVSDSAAQADSAAWRSSRRWPGTKRAACGWFCTSRLPATAVHSPARASVALPASTTGHSPGAA